MANFTFTQMHIESARNSTDDLNLFHDKKRWDWLKGNPFNGPIALGFQIACFIEEQVRRAREECDVHEGFNVDAFRFSSYELMFAGVVKPGDELAVNVKKGKLTEGDKGKVYANRLSLKANGKTILLGYKKESETTLITPPDNVPDFAGINQASDREFYQGSRFFLKRKYMIVGNAKNFLCSAFAEQSEYIDEFDDKVSFPETYPLGLISSALLERAMHIGHDLIMNPMVYTSHKLCLDRDRLKNLRSNDVLNVLVSDPIEEDSDGKVTHYCVGVLGNEQVLFHAHLSLAPLSSLVKS